MLKQFFSDYTKYKESNFVEQVLRASTFAFSIQTIWFILATVCEPYLLESALSRSPISKSALITALLLSSIGVVLGAALGAWIMIRFYLKDHLVLLPISEAGFVYIFPYEPWYGLSLTFAVIIVALLLVRLSLKLLRFGK